jgi:hypothetical protein
MDDEHKCSGEIYILSIYGRIAVGFPLPPLGHLRAYVRMALEKRLLPSWFREETDMEALGTMAVSDDKWCN